MLLLPKVVWWLAVTVARWVRLVWLVVLPPHRWRRVAQEPPVGWRAVGSGLAEQVLARLAVSVPEVLVQALAEALWVAAQTAKSTKSDFGFAPAVELSHDKVSTAAERWSSGASAEFEDFRGKLGEVAASYATIEGQNQAQAERTS